MVNILNIVMLNSRFFLICQLPRTVELAKENGHKNKK
jgi:hypothetical protein